MKRIRTLGLGVVMALALTAIVGAASASATGFEAEKYPATFVGETSPEVTLGFNHGGTTCSGVNFEAEAKTSTNSLSPASVANGTCAWFGSTTLKMNGCSLAYNPGAETGKGVFAGSFDIGPGGCGPISVVLKNNGSSAYCEITIGAQTGLKATYENLGGGSKATVKVTAGASNLKYTQKKSGSSCTNGSFENGTWSGSWTVRGLDSGKAQTGVRVSNPPRTPFTVGPSESEMLALFRPASYPVSIASEQTGTQVFTTKAGSASCAAAAFGSEAENPTAELTVTASYSSCSDMFGMAKGWVSMNGCSYVFEVFDGSAPYAGSASVACPKGKAIAIVGEAFGTVKCTVTIPSQSGLSGLSFDNGAWWSVGTSIGLSGIEYHQQAGAGFGACGTGDYSDGTYKGTTSLYAFQ